MGMDFVHDFLYIGAWFIGIVFIGSVLFGAGSNDR